MVSLVTFSKSNKPGICPTDPEDWGGLSCLIFGPILFDIGTCVYDLVSVAFASLLAIFTS